MSISTLCQHFLEKKQTLTRQIFEKVDISSLADLAQPLETFGQLQQLFQEALAQHERILQEQRSISGNISKLLRLSAADTCAFLLAISTFGAEYMQERSIPWLKETALASFVASQCFSKMSDYFSVKHNNHKDVLAEHLIHLHHVLKEELFVKLACRTLALVPSREEADSLQSMWENKRAIFISSLQGRDSDLIDIQLTEDETHGLLA